MLLNVIKAIALLLCTLKAVCGQEHLRRLRIKDESFGHEEVVGSENELLLDDGALWDRLLEASSMSLNSMSMDVSCVPDDIAEFKIDDNVNIGDVLLTPGPGFAASCGEDCITVKDSGDDPPFDPETGDTLRFAYKQVSSNLFSIRSRVCGVDCDGSDGFDGQFGRAGLMVRESLDFFSKNIYASHSPFGQADWSWRLETDGRTDGSFDGSPDVECLWITLERDGNDFTYSYAYESEDDECGLEGELLEDLTRTVTIDMPSTVFVGLGVSTAVSPPFCQFTEADFRDIECRGC